MRILLFTGKGGVGKTTTAAATAIRLADRGLKTLIVSTDAAHSLGDALALPLTGEPSEVAPGLFATQIDTQRRFEQSWNQLQNYLRRLLGAGGAEDIAAAELTVLPGVEEVLALLAVRELAESGRWDCLVVDCAPTAETLRLLALPGTLSWYLQRVFPLHRALARGARPLAALLGRSGTVPPDAAFDAILRLAEDLSGLRELLADPATTAVRLVLTPEAVVAAETRRTFTALALYGYQVDEVIANRIIPASDEPMSSWQRAWIRAQEQHLAAIEDSFAGLPVRRSGYRDTEPVGLDALREVADQLYRELPGDDPTVLVAGPALLDVTSVGSAASPEFKLVVHLPLADRKDVQASRSGDELVVTVAGHRRVLSLPSVLRRCRVESGRVSGGKLELLFVPDESLWPQA
ncbi:ArsA family ATPase [Jatrophihabitans telluris]|uniref:ArsA family ATPase n=1 Tax=Jatrophihabitans telluris TaxID=2038343 RepID=A0ABY4QU75_9ACTN|nr:ArsA family ATPase [Jatrophihabitans telluris]UQX87236.1 ArsA family ATPase [Jatrophihabitans telluris]